MKSQRWEKVVREERLQTSPWLTSQKQVGEEASVQDPEEEPGKLPAFLTSTLFYKETEAVQS